MQAKDSLFFGLLKGEWGLGGCVQTAMNQCVAWVRRVGVGVIEVSPRLGASLDMTNTRNVSTLRLHALGDGAYISMSLTDGA